MDDPPHRELLADSPRKDRTWLYVALAFVALWAGYLAVFNPMGKPLEDAPVFTPSSPKPATPVDFGWVLHDLDGKPVPFSDYRGRPILVNIWATWCGPCRQEMPTLVRLAANPRLKGVAFLTVTREDEIDKVKKYAQAEMQGLTVLRADDVPPAFVTNGIPATFLISADGTIAASEVGAVRWDGPSVVDFLEKLLKQSGPTRP